MRFDGGILGLGLMGFGLALGGGGLAILGWLEFCRYLRFRSDRLRAAAHQGGPFGTWTAHPLPGERLEPLSGRAVRFDKIAEGGHRPKGEPGPRRIGTGKQGRWPELTSGT